MEEVEENSEITDPCQVHVAAAVRRRPFGSDKPTVQDCRTSGLGFLSCCRQKADAVDTQARSRRESGSYIGLRYGGDQGLRAQRQSGKNKA